MARREHNLRSRLTTVTWAVSALFFATSACQPVNSQPHFQQAAPLISPGRKTSTPSKKSAQIKLPSKKYRKNAVRHDHVYIFDEAGGVTRKKVPEEEQVANGKALIKVANMHAVEDHIFEAQMFYRVFLPQILHPLYSNLDEDIKKKAREIMNSPENVAPIPDSIDSGKAKAIGNVLEWKSVEPRPDRDQYIPLSYPTARRTAKKLDKLFQPVSTQLNTGYNWELRQAMNTARILEEGQASPPETTGESDGKKTGQSSPAQHSSASKGSPGNSGVKSHIRPHSPIASTSKLPIASTKAVSCERSRSLCIVGKGKGKAVDQQCSSPESSGH
ncbi:hypothetical protein D9613_004342 [Agrocybe pediades]|uniref:Uncharacterized protein n=1 Tax=Agrocybe pediades TaxID=84607 RepID=A0A8H4QJG7_9AGAR|nr:hypothetical protein D9613_004342 [Agrocybe pediades]